MVKIQRIYDDKKTSGIRVLVDRVWPRGISKKDADLDYWLKDVAPTSELRQWFGHEPKLYAAFKEKYEKELRENEEQKNAFSQLKEIIEDNKEEVILLYGAKDEKYNQAVVLQEILS